ncbi:MAG: TRAP transporter large permease subunit [Deltaproteobacteria bacterium]|jgi:tripartite ATP-independent transporter DctM subunit|nr:MAG: TRAP transporter large permease subunit [Deltaproteobacteria bacterium]
MKALLTLLLIVAALSGAPLFVVIAAVALLWFYFMGVDLSIVVIEMYRLASNPLLIALLFFAFAGYVLAESEAGRRLVKLSTAIFGCVRGGLALVALLSCAFFTALTGASGITIVALGGLLLPALLEDRYPEDFSLGLLTSSGSLGLLFPPSLPMIIYGVVAGVSIPQLFLAGLIPGILLVVLLSIYSMYKGVRGECRVISFDFQELIDTFRETIWEVLLPVVVFGGIYSGFLAVSEVAVVTVVYVLLVALLINRDVRLNQMPTIVVKTAVMVGSIIIILGAALAFNSLLIDQQVPSKILLWIQGHVGSKFAFLLILNIFLLLVGCLLDVYSALVMVAPLIVPLAQGYDINLLHLGIIFLTNLQIGYSTPPIGMNLFIASLRFEKSVLRLGAASLPFLGILLVALLIITFVPGLSLLLVK